jgi:hypothetical protein
MTVGITELPPEGMQLGGVALAGDVDRGTKTTEGLSLLFTTAGITVQGPQPQIERLLVWSGLDTATCREKIALSDGRSAAVMELTSGGQSIRFLLPTESVTPGQAAYLDQALPAWLARYKGSTGSAPVPAPAPTASSPTQTAPGGISPAAGAGAAAAGAAAGVAAGAAAASTGGAEDGTGLSTSNGTAVPPPAAGVGAPASAPYSSAPPPPPPEPAATGAGSLLGSPTASGSSYGAPTSEPLPPPPPPPSATSSGFSTADAVAAGATGGWEGLTSPATGPEPTAWNTPPVGQDGGAGDVPPPSKKTRSWRRGSQGSEASPPVSGTPTGALAPPEPPADPVLLSPGALPQPSAPGPVVWKPPVDPVTGETVWDSAAPSPDFMAPDATSPKKSRPWRRGSKAAVAGGAAVGAAAIVGGTDATDLIAPVGGTDSLGAPGLATPAPPTAPGAWAAGPGEVGDAPADPFGSAAPPFSAPGGPVPPTTGESPAKGVRNNRTAMLLLAALVAVVIIGGGVYYWKHHNNNNTTTSAVTPVSPSASDVALAGTINLRLTDLPAGWTRGVTVGQVPRPPVAPVAAQLKAGQAMATCTGQSVAVVSGLFGSTLLPGESARVLSPTFASGAVPGIQMFSTTTVMSSAAGAQALAAPFNAANFATCFGQYQSALVAAAVPGSTAAVSTVVLTAPAGVKSYGYVTTFTIPGQGTQVVGEAFIIGGSTETRLEPSTNGPVVPATAFGPAYTNVVGRVAQYSK